MPPVYPAEVGLARRERSMSRCDARSIRSFAEGFPQHALVRDDALGANGLRNAKGSIRGEWHLTIALRREHAQEWVCETRMAREVKQVAEALYLRGLAERG
jgi:hypothetical protein